MTEQVFCEQMEGLMIERVIRDNEFSMQYRHSHDSYELYFLMEGERYYFINQETYRVEAHMAVLVKKSQIHKTSMGQGTYHDRILLQLREEVFDPFLRANGLFSLSQLFEENDGVLKLETEDWNRAEGLLLQICRELKERREGYQTMVKLEAAQLLLLLYRLRKTSRFSQEIQKLQTARHQKVHEIADYLLAHSSSNEGLEELAARFYISKSYMCRIFRDVTGFTVNEYRNAARIRQAKHLLVHSSCSITALSERLGYDSITYFERVFRKYADMTPLQYRKGRRPSKGLEPPRKDEQPAAYWGACGRAESSCAAEGRGER